MSSQRDMGLNVFFPSPDAEHDARAEWPRGQRFVGLPWVFETSQLCIPDYHDEDGNIHRPLAEMAQLDTLLCFLLPTLSARRLLAPPPPASSAPPPGRDRPKRQRRAPCRDDCKCRGLGCVPPTAAAAAAAAAAATAAAATAAAAAAAAAAATAAAATAAAAQLPVYRSFYGHFLMDRNVVLEIFDYVGVRAHPPPHRVCAEYVIHATDVPLGRFHV
jgi:hypothetical protein